jgi:hypothetical protein
VFYLYTIKINDKTFGRFIYSFYICNVNQKTNEMNQINEVINYEKARCREIYMPDLMMILKSQSYVWMSWGADKFTVDNIKKPRMFRMYVRGNHHKGHVYIFLNGLDLFDVYLTNSKGVIKDRTDEQGIYNDQLVEWIDEKVEKLPNYVR